MDPDPGGPKTCGSGGSGFGSGSATLVMRVAVTINSCLSNIGELYPTHDLKRGREVSAFYLFSLVRYKESLPPTAGAAESGVHRQAPHRDHCHCPRPDEPLQDEARAL
jgi:hypothetical protein